MSYEHRDTNCGEGMYRDTPEEKEIERLTKALKAERAAHEETKRQIETLEVFLQKMQWLDNPSKRPVGRIIWKVEQLIGERDDLRAKLAQAEALLRAARCPNCDGSGARLIKVAMAGDAELEQCQWCYLKDAALASEQEKQP